MHWQECRKSGEASRPARPVLIENSHAIAHRQGLFLVVGHKDEGDPDLPLEGLQLCLHRLSELEVKSPQRFVQQQNRWAIYQRPRQCHSLPLATGELGRAATAQSLQANEGKRLLGPSSRSAAPTLRTLSE